MLLVVRPKLSTPSRTSPSPISGAGVSASRVFSRSSFRIWKSMAEAYSAATFQSRATALSRD
jgi:hypothetical protein